jgi:hypothetical protein
MEQELSTQQTAAGIINPHSFSQLSPPDQKEKNLLRELARELADRAARPVEKKKQALWTDHNDLRETRPLVFIDPENGWNEIITQDMLRCEHPVYRVWEMYLRKELHWADVLKDDKVIEARFPVSYDYTDSGWGLTETQIVSGTKDGSYTWEAPLQNYDEDFEQLTFPLITVDYERTDRIVDIARSLFDGILEIELRGVWWWTLGMTWDFIKLRGLENLMLDMYDNPDGVHKLMAFLRDGMLQKLNFLEDSGLLSLNTGGTYVGSGGFGWTRELAAEDSETSPVRTQDMWGFAESQETVGVAPQMFGEFIFPYQKSILERFGLNCYGCCEGLDKRFHYVKQFPRLRRISVSPWADKKTMSEYLGKDYIYSLKPQPAVLAAGSIDEDYIRREARDYLEITKANRTEIIMKDNHTLGGNPDNARRWVEILRSEIDRIY